MASAIPRPDTVNKLRCAADAAFAILAGMQLELFTPLKGGPKSAEDIAHAIGVGPARLRLLLYSLVAAGLLIEEHRHFSNSPEANQFLVKGGASYIGNWHTIFSNRWARNLKIAESIRTGVPQAKIDFSNSPQEELETYLRRINVLTVAAAHAMLERYDFSSTKALADVGCGGAGVALTMAEATPIYGRLRSIYRRSLRLLKRLWTRKRRPTVSGFWRRMCWRAVTWFI